MKRPMINAASTPPTAPPTAPAIAPFLGAS